MCCWEEAVFFRVPKIDARAVQEHVNAMSPRNLFLSNLLLIERITVSVAHRNRLSESDAKEFASRVRLRLVEDGYAVFRKFEGRSSLSTYLTVVIQRVLADWRFSA